jgi:hypothetical protein
MPSPILRPLWTDGVSTESDVFPGWHKSDVFVPDAPIRRWARAAGLKWLQRLLSGRDSI